MYGIFTIKLFVIIFMIKSMLGIIIDYDIL